MEQTEPSCVYACPHDAAHRVEPLTFFGGMLGIEKRSPQGSTAETSKMRAVVLIDRSHKPWAMASAAILLIAVAAYIPYAAGSAP